MMKWYAQWLVFGAITVMPAVAFSFAGYANKPKEAPASPGKTEPASTPAEAKNAVTEKVPTVSGKILETLNGGGYTYINLESKDGQKKWYAVPAASVKVGQELELMQGTEMGQFTSRALNRTFDSIVFSGGIVVTDDEETIKKAHQDVMKSVGEEAGEVPIKVEKAAGSNGYTVGDVYSKKTDLNGKNIAVKGKVVKVSSGIMGKTWIHLRDGSGDGSKGTNDLILTTKDAANVGDIVTVTGNVSVDKDFGSGYKYNVIIEDATVKQ